MRSSWRIQGFFLLASAACALAIIAYEILPKHSGQTSFADVSHRAENGNATDQYNLGFMYSTGQGVPQDYSKAAFWYRKAAEQGNSMGENGLGFLYSNGRGVPQDYAEALRWYRRAAEQGNAKADFNIGSAYLYGRGIRQDTEEASLWYARAADRGDEEAQRLTGRRWMGRDIVSRIILPVISIFTTLYLGAAVMRRRSILDREYRSLALTAFVGITYVLLAVFVLPQTSLDKYLLVDHASYSLMNAIIGAYIVQVFSQALQHDIISNRYIIALGVIIILLIAFNVYACLHFDMLNNPITLRTFCLINGLLVGIVVSLGWRVAHVWIFKYGSPRTSTTLSPDA